MALKQKLPQPTENRHPLCRLFSRETSKWRNSYSSLCYGFCASISSDWNIFEVFTTWATQLLKTSRKKPNAGCGGLYDLHVLPPLLSLSFFWSLLAWTKDGVASSRQLTNGPGEMEDPFYNSSFAYGSDAQKLCPSSNDLPRRVSPVISKLKNVSTMKWLLTEPHKFEACDCPGVCVDLLKRSKTCTSCCFISNLNHFSIPIFCRGCHGHQWVWHQRRHSLFACDMKKGRFLHVPADSRDLFLIIMYAPRIPTV